MIQFTSQTDHFAIFSGGKMFHYDFLNFAFFTALIRSTEHHLFYIFLLTLALDVTCSEFGSATSSVKTIDSGMLKRFDSE